MESFDTGNKLTFMMPGLPPAQEGEETITICRKTIVNLLNIGRKQFEKAQGMVNISKPDGKKKGRTGINSSKGKYYIEIYASLHQFF